MRASVVVLLASVWLASSCSRDPTPSPGVVAAAVRSPDGTLRVYKGQPGILQDIPRIERGETLSYHWSRIEFPSPIVDLASSGPTRVDMAVSQDPTVHFWQFLRSGPGCDTEIPFLLKIESGDPRVSGWIELRISQDGIMVTYQLDVDGWFDGPCGHVSAGIQMDNAYTAVPASL